MTAKFLENWFWPVATMLVAVAWALSISLPVAPTPSFEWAVLFDALVTLPLLFLLCYRGKFSRTALAARVIALQCVGIWLAAKLVPVGSQSILPHLAWVRWIGLVIVALFEVRLVVAVVKLQLKPTARQDEFEAAGIPPLLAKLALLEARFWRWIMRRPGK